MSSATISGASGRLRSCAAGFCLWGRTRRLPSISRLRFHVRTMKSTDEGVAFLVECGGKRIYHAGDLNNWVWSGEPEADNLRMSENYRLELEKMKGNHVDVAFVPLDPRQEGDFYGAWTALCTRWARMWYSPCISGETFTVTDKLKQLECSADYRSRVMEIHRCGEEFVI